MKPGEQAERHGSPFEEVVSLDKFDKHLSVICGQVSILLCLEIVSFRNFVSFVLILLSSLLHLKKGLCDPIFSFVKTVGSEVYKGKFRLCW